MRITPNHDPQDLDDLMPELRRQHRSIAAPPSLEIALRAAADSRQASASRAPQALGRLRPSWVWALTAAAVVLALMGIGEWRLHHQKQHLPSSDSLQAQHQPKPTLHEAFKTGAPTPSDRLQPASAHRIPRHTPRAVGGGASQQTWQSEFVALPASEGLPPATAITLVRMQIQQNSLQQYGLEVPAEPTARTLLAEFMVGEDGLPRAVRILP